MLRDRREFLQAIASAACVPLAAQAGPIAEDDPGNAKLSHRIVAKSVSDDDLRFLQQIGLRWARLEWNEGEDASFDTLRAFQQRFARFGMRIHSGVHYSYRSKRVQLGLPGRDQDIETYRRFLRDLGKLGIPVASYDFHPANTYTTAMVERRGYTAREFDVETFRTKVEKQAFEREYSAGDIWAAYTYFMKAALPAAEEAGVIMALHPDDPPLSPLRGIARICISAKNYRRIMELVPSRVNGVTFCQANFVLMGEDIEALAREWCRKKKIFFVHFRDVTGTREHFHETFHDNGSTNMVRMLQVYSESGFNGPMRPDHAPTLANEDNDHPGYAMNGKIFAFGYMAGIMRALKLPYS